jgi:hypothetical protein
MGCAALAADYLFAGPLIEARIAEQVPDVPTAGVEALAQLGAEDLRPRAAFVMWGGDRFDTSDAGRSGLGRGQMVTQRWVVWLYVRHVSPVNMAARNRAAGAYLSKIHKALAGWQPEGADRKLARGQGTAPNYSPQSGLYPLTFELTLTL